MGRILPVSLAQALTPMVGDIVENCGAIVRVDEVDPVRGLLVEIIPWTKDGVEQGGIGQRYYAAADKCRLVKGVPV